MGKAPSKIQYKNGIVTFLDILGWRNHLATKSPSELNNVLTALRKEVKPTVPPVHDAEHLEWKTMYEYAVLSDCVFRCSQIDHIINRLFPYGQFFHELNGLVFVQARVICQGFLLRGAMAFGQYYGSRDRQGVSLFGPAIAKAYTMESELANYPRVVVDPELIAEFWRDRKLQASGDGFNDLLDEWDFQILNCLRRDDAGVWFIDYLKGYWKATGDGNSTSAFYLKHKELLESELERLGQKDYPNKEMDKILWLARYHNSTMDKLTDEDLMHLSGDSGSIKRYHFHVSMSMHPACTEYDKWGERLRERHEQKE